VIKKVHINIRSILDGYGVMTAFSLRTRNRVNRVSSRPITAIPYLPAGRQVRGVQGEASGLICPTVISADSFNVVHPAPYTTERQPVLRPEVAFSNISFKHR
jgi:hypothetical protein